MHPQTPLRMTIANLVNNESIRPQYNPETFSEEVGANWSKLTINGLSHQHKQFTHTEDLKLNITLPFDATSFGEEGMVELLRIRRFLMSCCYPRAGAGAVRTAGAPRLLFVWPNLVSLTSVMVKCKFDYQRFNILGYPIGFVASCEIEEIRDVIVTMEEVYEYGSQRSNREQEGA